MRVEAYKGYGGENRWFFFTVREQSSSNKEKEPSRKVRGVPGVTATWKATGSVQLIRRSKDRDKVVVGSKRVLIYNSSDQRENGKWSMHEYILKDHAEVRTYVRTRLIISNCVYMNMKQTLAKRDFIICIYSPVIDVIYNINHYFL